MRIPKIKVNKVSTDNIFKPLSLVTLYLLERCEDEALQEALISAIINVIDQIGGKEMVDEFKEFTKKEIDSFFEYSAKKKEEAAAN